MKIFNINKSTESLALEICKSLNVELGKLVIDKFSDGEYSPQFGESIRNQTVFLISNTRRPNHIIKTLLTIDAAKRASANQIIAILPYYGYSRQDKKEGPRGPIGAKLMADLLSSAGLTSVILLDLHAEQIEGYFNFPVNHIKGKNVFVPYIEQRIDSGLIGNGRDIVICSPDSGGVGRAMSFYKKLKRKYANVSFAMMEKHREKPNEIAHMNLIGDVNDKDVIIIDDMCDTAGTLSKASSKLKLAGANTVRAVITHPVLSGNAYININESDLEEVLVSNSISIKDLSDKITVVDASYVFAKAIEVIVNSRSLHEINN